MGIWQIIWFVVTNIPALIKLIKDLIDLFDGDKKAASVSLSGLPLLARESKLRTGSGVDATG